MTSGNEIRHKRGVTVISDTPGHQRTPEYHSDTAGGSAFVARLHTGADPGAVVAVSGIQPHALGTVAPA